MASALLSQKLCLRLGRGEFMITIKDNIIKLDFHEETLHCDIYADGMKWTWQYNYQPYFKYNGKDVLFSEAKNVSHKRYDT